MTDSSSSRPRPGLRATDGGWSEATPCDREAETDLRERGIEADPAIVRFASKEFVLPIHDAYGRLCSTFRFHWAGLGNAASGSGLDGLVGLCGGLASIGSADLLLTDDPFDLLAAHQALRGTEGVRVLLPVRAAYEARLELLYPVLRDHRVFATSESIARELVAAGTPAFLLPIKGRLSEDLLDARNAGQEPATRLNSLMEMAVVSGPYDPDAILACKKARSILADGFARASTSTVTTGLPSIDRLLGNGFLGGRLSVLAGLTAWGKTAFVLSVIREAARHGVPAIYLTYEVSPHEALVRMIGSECGIPYGRVINGSLSEAERETFDNATNSFLSGVGRFVRVETGSRDDDAAREVKRLVTEVKAARGRAPLVVLDYLQAVLGHRESGSEGGSVRLGINQLIRTLREDIAVGLNCSVVAVSSLGRAAYLQCGDEWRPPSLKDLKESGDIEYVADAVLTIWPTKEDWSAHEARSERRTSPTRPLDVHLLKGRLIGTGIAEVRWNPALGTFEDQSIGVIGSTPPPKGLLSRPSAGASLSSDDLVNLIRHHGGTDSGTGTASIPRDRARRLAGAFASDEKGFDVLVRRAGDSVRREIRDGVDSLVVGP